MKSKKTLYIGLQMHEHPFQEEAESWGMTIFKGVCGAAGVAIVFGIYCLVCLFPGHCPW